MNSWFCCCIKETKSNSINEPILNDWNGSDSIEEREQSITWQDYPTITETYSNEEYDRTIDNEQIERNKETSKLRRLLQNVCNISSNKQNNSNKDEVKSGIVQKDTNKNNNVNREITYHAFYKSI